MIATSRSHQIERDGSVRANLRLPSEGRTLPYMTTKADEEQAMEQVATRLMEHFPHVTRDQVAAIVDQEHQLYDGRPVRDFVPVLVERAARHRLAQEATAIILQRDVEAAAVQYRRVPHEVDPDGARAGEESTHPVASRRQGRPSFVNDASLG